MLADDADSAPAIRHLGEALAAIGRLPPVYPTALLGAEGYLTEPVLPLVYWSIYAGLTDVDYFVHTDQGLAATWGALQVPVTNVLGEGDHQMAVLYFLVGAHTHS
eukprot:4125382-Amphidinium_carterae.2